MIQFQSAVVLTVAADAVDDVTGREFFEPQLLSVNRVGRDGLQIIRDQFVERLEKVRTDAHALRRQAAAELSAAKKSIEAMILGGT